MKAWSMTHEGQCFWMSSVAALGRRSGSMVRLSVLAQRLLPIMTIVKSARMIFFILFVVLKGLLRVLM